MYCHGKNFFALHCFEQSFYNWTRSLINSVFSRLQSQFFTAEHDLNATTETWIVFSPGFLKLISQKSLMMSLQKRRDNKRKKTHIFSDESIKRTASNNKKARNFCYSFYLLADDGKIFFNSSFIFSVTPTPLAARNFYRPEGHSVVTSFDFKVGNEEDWKFHLLCAAGNCIK